MIAFAVASDRGHVLQPTLLYYAGTGEQLLSHPPIHYLGRRLNAVHPHKKLLATPFGSQHCVD